MIENPMLVFRVLPAGHEIAVRPGLIQMILPTQDPFQTVITLANGEQALVQAKFNTVLECVRGGDGVPADAFVLDEPDDETLEKN